MASLILHQIIGEIYCEKNNIKDKESFLLGNLSPDILPTNKDANHYTTTKQLSTYINAIKERVNLYNYCTNNTIDTEYNKGYFLHLVTDYIFYERLIINNPKFAEFISYPSPQSSSKMYTEYDRIAYYVCNTYPNINISNLPTFATNIMPKPLTLFTENQISQFIEICSKLNLEDVYIKILNNNYEQLNSINF